MRPQRKANAAGTPAYKYIYFFFFFPPSPKRRGTLLPGCLAAAKTHEQIAALHGFGLK